jgi:hypothetical protein
MALQQHYNPIVFDRKTVFMQRLADFVRLGYRHYVLGEVRPDRAWALASKFRRLYEVHLHRNQRARARANGEGSAYVLWWQPHAESVVFALLLTPGQHAAQQLEKLLDAAERGGRLKLGAYELVQRPREGKAAPAWTWRLTDEAYEGWRARVLEVVRGGNDFVVQQLVTDLMATPGFAGVREQVKKLKALFRAEWARRRGKQQMPALPRQRFVQRLENKGVRLSSLCSSRTTAVTLAGEHGDARSQLGRASP